MSHETFTDCASACNECAAACEHCANACLKEKEVAKMVDCIRLDRDCADICRLAEALMARQSRFAKEFCALCAQVCDACASECAKHEAQHCQDCAKACRRCAEECRKMSGMN